jgi:hypothetical protein
MIRIGGDHPLQDLHRPIFIALTLAIERCDREIHLRIEPVGVRIGECVENPSRILVFELSHEADAAVVVGDELGSGWFEWFGFGPDW